MLAKTSTLPAPALQLSDVSETGLLTLYCRARESLSPDPILTDEKAVEITRALNPLLEQSGSKTLRNLATGKISGPLIVHISLRARQYDQYARDFLARHPDGAVVNLGCGLDSRCLRLGGESGNPAHFFDLDLPAVMRVRQQFFQDGRTLPPVELFRLRLPLDGRGPVVWAAAHVIPGRRPLHVPAARTGERPGADPAKALPRRGAGL